MLRRGLLLREVQYVLGHSSARMTERYAHLAPSFRPPRAIELQKPYIRGHRIWVSLILDLLADGMSTEEILSDYPGLDEADVRACIAYGHSG